MASQFADGLFQAGMAGALLFNPERAATPLQIAGAFAAMFLPYSLLGPFVGALLDRWDRRLVLIAANLARLLVVAGIGTLFAVGAGAAPMLCGALIFNGFARFVSSGLSAALPDVVPCELVVTMNSVATAAGAVAAFAGANCMLLPRWLAGANDQGASAVVFIVAIPVSFALVVSLRFGPRVLGPGETKNTFAGSALYAVVTGWLYGARAVFERPTVVATLSGLTAHRLVLGVNTLLVLVLVRDTGAAVHGLGGAALFMAAAGTGSFLATAMTPAIVRRWGRYSTVNGALLFAALVQIAGVGLQLPVLVVCGFFLASAGQVVKLCADTAMQIDVDDALRGHVFAVQDALFWVAFIAAISVGAVVIPANGHAPMFASVGTALYLVGLTVHAVVGRGRLPASDR